MEVRWFRDVFMFVSSIGRVQELIAIMVLVRLVLHCNGPFLCIYIYVFVEMKCSNSLEYR
jgi:hypothetical protein